MVFVDFSDIAGSDDPTTVGHSFTDKFQSFYEAQSFGKLKIQTEILPDYLHITKDSMAYGMNVWGGGSPTTYWNDGLYAASKVKDLTKYDFVVVMPPSGISQILYGPSFPGIPPQIKGNFKSTFSGAVGGADQRTKASTTGWIWLSHEIGHDLGFEHQYGYAPQPVWDLMDNVYIDTAPELFGWNRFVQGWLSSNQVACLPPSISESGAVSLHLDAIENQNDSLKIALIPLSPDKLIGLEFRTKSGFDNVPSDQIGVLPYLINPTAGSNERAIEPLNKDGRRDLNGQLFGTLRVGDIFISNGYKFTVDSMTQTGADISIAKQ